MSKEKIYKIALLVFIIILVLANITRLVPEEKNYEKYKKALSQYSSGNFQQAYYSFSKVSKFSKLKPAAIFRQGLCAEKLNDLKTEEKKYKEVIRKYPNSEITPRSKYLISQLEYEKNNFNKAQKGFKHILEKYPNTDYATAAEYYLGSIEVEKSNKLKNKKKKIKAQQKAIKYFKSYLKEAPLGRFSINCIDKWVGLKPKLNNEDYLLIAKVYAENGNYEKASSYLKFTNITTSWPYFVKVAHQNKDYSKVKYYTELGVRGKGTNEISINDPLEDKDKNKNIYEGIDTYLKISSSPKVSMSYLLSIANKNTEAYEYLFYKNCNNMPLIGQTACFNTLFAKYPKGNFSAEALSNSFYAKIKDKKYFSAKKIGQQHLKNFPNAKSAPKVMFWLGKINQRIKNYEEARWYFKTLIKKYPDDYYAYRAYMNLKRIKSIEIRGLNDLAIEFPYKNKKHTILTELAKVKDYGLINQLCKDDKFIQSWLAYLEGEYSKSSVLARDELEKIEPKPAQNDLRWRLAYPIHYFEDIKNSANVWGNNPILILSIIREESYFNPKAQSPVGARGLMQLMPSTASEAALLGGISLTNPNMIFNPEINIRLGNVYYSRLKNGLSDKDILAILAYNGGIGSVSKWKANIDYEDLDDFVEQIPYSETQNYLKKVYRSYWNYLRIYTDMLNQNTLF